MIDLTRDGLAVDQDNLSVDQGDGSTDTDTAALLREIVELTTVPPVKPGDITLVMYAAAAGNISIKTARSRLDALVRRGILTTPGLRRDLATSQKVRVWRRAVQE